MNTREGLGRLRSILASATLVASPDVETMLLEYDKLLYTLQLHVLNDGQVNFAARPALAAKLKSEDLFVKLRDAMRADLGDQRLGSP